MGINLDSLFILMMVPCSLTHSFIHSLIHSLTHLFIHSFVAYPLTIFIGKTPTWYLRAESLREKKSWLMRLAHVHAIVKWLDDYEKVRVLGVGGTGIVYELLHKQNGQRYAMKEMEIKSKSQMKMAIQEAEMLKVFSHLLTPSFTHPLARIAGYHGEYIPSECNAYRESVSSWFQILSCIPTLHRR